jgi:hypothetical protein
MRVPDKTLQTQNLSMVAFDGALAAGALLAPRGTLRLIGHRHPSADAVWLFRRCAPIWATFAAAHATAAIRGEPQDWWALAWLRATEIGTDILWAQSPGFSGSKRRLLLAGAAVANLAMTAAYRASARRGPVSS